MEDVPLPPLPRRPPRPPRVYCTVGEPRYDASGRNTTCALQPSVVARLQGPAIYLVAMAAYDACYIAEALVAASTLLLGPPRLRSLVAHRLRCLFGVDTVQYEWSRTLSAREQRAALRHLVSHECSVPKRYLMRRACWMPRAAREPAAGCALAARQPIVRSLRPSRQLLRPLVVRWYAASCTRKRRIAAVLRHASQPPPAPPVTVSVGYVRLRPRQPCELTWRAAAALLVLATATAAGRQDKDRR